MQSPRSAGTAATTSAGRSFELQEHVDGVRLDAGRRDWRAREVEIVVDVVKACEGCVTGQPGDRDPGKTRPDLEGALLHDLEDSSGIDLALDRQVPGLHQRRAKRAFVVRDGQD